MTASPAPHPLPRPLRKLAGRALETALNHALSLDPDTQAKLAALDGRSVQLHLQGVNMALAVTVPGAGAQRSACGGHARQPAVDAVPPS